ncbi:WYL domain-containing protein [Carnobacterium gallinarum]|uniref:WYL domain-containing protein n=1 Tax=Carnobacterium gallinarum TaxID=2749 RepID=UPI0006899308|nr:WYL domain-containing protein [Carnobacterium gallinarum]
MAKTFNELIKNFSVIRQYVRDFYIYGFKQREDFTHKSSRSYDNERRRIESYLAEYVTWDYIGKKKVMRLTIDTKKLTENPLFAVWKAKTFTRNDIFLHFILLDILQIDNPFSLNQILDRIDQNYLIHFEDDYLIEPLTLRKKLKEYVQLGILTEAKLEKELVFCLVPPITIKSELQLALDFYKDSAPIGILGHFLAQQKTTEQISHFFSYKHYFVVHTLEEQILLNLLDAIQSKTRVLLTFPKGHEVPFTPVRIMVSVETGRQYVVGRSPQRKFLKTYRLDQIETVTGNQVDPLFAEIKQQYLAFQAYTWNAGFANNPPQQLRVTLSINEATEFYLIERIESEGRMGTLKRIDHNLFLYHVTLHDLHSINPFLRTLIGRIVDIETSNQQWKKQFLEDLDALYRIYLPKEVDTSDE